MAVVCHLSKRPEQGDELPSLHSSDAFQPEQLRATWHFAMVLACGAAVNALQ
jgi:hypothetical protein